MMDKDDWLGVLARHTASWPTNMLLDASVWEGLADTIAQAHEEELDDQQAALNARWQHIEAEHMAREAVKVVEGNSG